MLKNSSLLDAIKVDAIVPTMSEASPIPSLLLSTQSKQPSFFTMIHAFAWNTPSLVANQH